jgi:hypothetical protein
MPHTSMSTQHDPLHSRHTRISSLLQFLHAAILVNFVLSPSEQVVRMIGFDYRGFTCIHEDPRA